MISRFLRPLVVAGLTVALTAATPLAANAAPTMSALTRATRATGVHVVPASGDFTAALDVTSIRLLPVGARCLLTVNGTLTFSGTLQGTATGTTAALEDATCTDVAANPPGTFADVFRSSGTFSGTVEGRPTEAEIVYAGRTAPGGSINAVMLFTGGFTGVLQVRATVGVGGSYRGLVIQP